MDNIEKYCCDCEFYSYNVGHDETYCSKKNIVLQRYASEQTTYSNHAKYCDEYLNAEEVRKEKVKREYLFDKWSNDD